MCAALIVFSSSAAAQDFEFDLQDFFFAESSKYSGQQDFMDPIFHREDFLVGTGISLQTFDTVLHRYLKYRNPNNALGKKHRALVRNRVEELGMQVKATSPQLKVAIRRLEQLILKIEAAQDFETQKKPVSYWEAHNKALATHGLAEVPENTLSDDQKRQLNKTTHRILQNFERDVRKPKAEMRLQLNAWLVELKEIRDDFFEAYVLTEDNKISWGLGTSEGREAPQKLLSIPFALKYILSPNPKDRRSLYYNDSGYWTRYEDDNSQIQLVTSRGVAIRNELGDSADFLRSLDLMETAYSVHFLGLATNVLSYIKRLLAHELTEKGLKRFVADIQVVKADLQGQDQPFAYETWLNFFDNQFTDVRVDAQFNVRSIESYLAWALNGHPVPPSKGPHFMVYLVDKVREIVKQDPELLKMDAFESLQAGSSPDYLADVSIQTSISPVSSTQPGLALFQVVSQSTEGNKALVFEYMEPDTPLRFHSYDLAVPGTKADLVTQSIWMSVPSTRILPIEVPVGFKLIDFSFRLAPGVNLNDQLQASTKMPFYKIEADPEENFYRLRLNLKKGTAVQITSKFKKVKGPELASKNTDLVRLFPMAPIYPLIDDLYVMGELELSKALEERLSTNPRISMKGLSKIIAQHTRYTYGAHACLKSMDRRHLMDFEPLVRDGQMNVQCVAAAELTHRFFTAAFGPYGYQFASITRTDRKDEHSPINRVYHRILAVYKNSQLLGYIDSTPAYRPNADILPVESETRSAIINEELKMRLLGLQSLKSFQNVVNKGDRSHPSWRMSILASLIASGTPESALAGVYAHRLGTRGITSPNFVEQQIEDAAVILKKMSRRDPLEKAMIEASESLLKNIERLLEKASDCEELLKAAE